MRITLTLALFLLLWGCSSQNSKENLPAHKPLSAYQNETWFEHYRHNRLDSACLFLDDYLDTNENELPAMAYYAEALYRLKRFTESERLTDSIIKLDSTFGWPYRLKGEVRRAQYGKNSYTNRDSSDYYLQKATTVANPSLNTHEVLWIDAMENGDFAKASLSLRKLYDGNYYPKALLSYGRLMLEALPDSAILITNGDNDTYPLLVVQECKKVRPDVAILNQSLLNLKRYIANSAQRYNLTQLLPQKHIEAFTFKMVDGAYLYISDQAIAHIKSEIDKDNTTRPLCLANGFPLNQRHPKLVSLLKNKTYHLLHMRTGKTGEEMHTTYEGLKKELELVKPDDFKGPYISLSHHSPVILNSTSQRSRRFDTNIMYFSFDLLYKAAEEGDQSSYDDIITWQNEFCRIVENDDAYLQAKMKHFREKTDTLLQSKLSNL